MVIKTSAYIENWTERDDRDKLLAALIVNIHSYSYCHFVNQQNIRRCNGFLSFKK